MGRKKIAIKSIDDDRARQVPFSDKHIPSMYSLHLGDLFKEKIGPYEEGIRTFCAL